LVPVKNGVIPEAPEGEHSSQDGTLLDGTGVPVADEPPEPVRPEDVVPALPASIGWAYAQAQDANDRAKRDTEGREQREPPHQRGPHRAMVAQCR